jgi:predicted ATP-grasp superfamily ATP-dependent carboligase
MTVLLLDGQQRSALAVVRSLGRRGIEVHVADAETACLAGASRHARSRLRYPDPYLDPSAFVSWVRETAVDRGFDTVFPVTDASSMALLAARDKPAGVRYVCAQGDSYEQVTNKASLIELATRVGVRIPRTDVVTGLAEIERYIARAQFPLVIKPARSRLLLAGRIISTSVFVAASAEEARRFARAQPWIEVLPCLMQEFVEGHGAGVFAMYASGRPIAWFAHRRIREKPPRGGVSVLCESTAADPFLRSCAERILDAAHYEGAAMVEFRVDPHGAAYLMEINARLWGSLQLAIDCGVDFPWLMYESFSGRAVQPIERYVVGRRLRWFLGDLDNLLIELKGNGLSRTAGERLRSVARAALTTFDFGARNEVLRWSDPRPGLLEIGQWVHKLA